MLINASWAHNHEDQCGTDDPDVYWAHDHDTPKGAFYLMHMIIINIVNIMIMMDLGHIIMMNIMKLMIMIIENLMIIVSS